MNSTERLMQRGTQCHQAGQLAEAEDMYRQVLLEEPNHPHALHQLGMLALAAGQFPTAVALISSALKALPNQPAFWANLGHAYRQMGQPESAAACYANGVKFDSSLSSVWRDLAGMLSQLGRHEAAETALRAAVLHAPREVQYWVELGDCLEIQKRPDEAAESYRSALAIAPHLAKAHHGLAIVLADQGQLEAAAQHYSQAIRSDPNLAAAHNNLGALFTKLERPDEAEARYRRALALAPMPEASANLGSLLASQGRFEEARQCYAEAARHHPRADAWALGMMALCPAVFESNEAIDQYRAKLLAELNDFVARNPSFRFSQLPQIDCRPSFNLSFHGRDERPIREAFARALAGCFPQDAPAGSASGRRIGFLVTEGREHTFAKSIGGIVDRISRDRFELAIVCSVRGAEVLRARLKNPAIEILSATNDLDGFAEVARGARLDVLYHWEFNTANLNYFLPFLRLAPRQCTSWGGQFTSGIPQMDYYLSSTLLEPAGAESHYSERLLLGRTLPSYQQRASLPAAAKPREAFGFTAAQHLYVCAQQLAKCHPDFDPILAGILRADPQGVIVLTEDRLSRYVVEQLRSRFARTMPDVAGRVLFVPFQPYADYLGLVAAADVLLDPLHFCGCNGSYDALSLNQPVVTLPGRFQRGRYTLGCYQRMGMLDLVARDAAHYVELAVELATNSDFRQTIVEKITATSGELFDDNLAVRDHEEMFEAMLSLDVSQPA